jgi:glycosyltransferase involved in cell wall biosynthesis
VEPKILFILHIPPPINGAAMVGKYIQESSYINQSFEADYINLTTSFSLDKIGKGGVSKFLALFRIQRKVIKALLRKEYDLCYMSLTAKGAGFYKDLFVVFILKLFRRKIIYHFHNKGVALNSKSLLNNFLYKFVFQNTQSILLSPSLYKDIQCYVKPEVVYFCANGIPTINNYSLQHEKNNNAEVVKLLFLSNMMTEKGVPVLLEACSLLKERGLNFECHFVGAWSDISENTFLSTVERFNIPDYVFAHGKKYNEEKLAFFNQSCVFVFPTYYHNECFPLVLLEAMEQGLAVVSTPEGGISDIVDNGETGFLVPQKNAKALAEKLELLILQPELCAQMGANGRKRYEELFTLERFEQNLKTILEKAVAQESA